MLLVESHKLKNLFYGHPGKFISSLKGRFDPLKMDESEPIQLAQMKCGCWVVLDGNNRIGLILKENPEASMRIIPEKFIRCYPKGQWDEETLKWWNPYPKPFDLVIKYSYEVNKIRKKKSSYKNEEEYKKAIDQFMQVIKRAKHICKDQKNNTIFFI